MELLNNIDLLSVGVTVASTCIMGFTVYFSNHKSITNKTFLFFSLITAVWGVVNYLNYQFNNQFLVLWFLRIVLFLAVWQAFSLFQLFYVFPLDKFYFPREYKYFLVPLVAIVSIITLTPLTFSQIIVLSNVGQVSDPDRGAGLIAFGITAVSLVIFGLTILINKFRRASTSEKRPLKFILLGTLIMFLLIIVFNFLVPVIMHNRSFIPLGAVFTFPFVVLTFYAIYKHKLFNIKVAAIAFVAFILTIYSFINIIYSGSLGQVVANTTYLILVLIGSVFLIKSVLIEIEQREKIELQEKELEIANQQQVTLIHFITHQIKGFFTKSKYIFSAMIDGDYGQLPAPVAEVVRKGFDSDNKGIAMVEDILNAANLKKGTVKYEKKLLDLKSLIQKTVEDQRSMAEAKGLKFNVDMGNEKIALFGDEEQLRHAFKNIIDNSIHYTPSGRILVKLRKQAEKILFSTEDTGVGISREDKEKLFTQGGRGKNSIHINTDSTGYGLFIVKQIVEAHNGRVWAESEGEGKGSKFYIELPSTSS